MTLSPVFGCLCDAARLAGSSSELNGVGIVVLDVDRNFEFVKRIPTWNVAASTSPEEVCTRRTGNIPASDPLSALPETRLVDSAVPPVSTTRSASGGRPVGIT